LDRSQLFLLFAFIVFLLSLVYILRSVKKYHLWELREQELLRGRPVNFRIALDEVEFAFWCYIGSSKYLILKLDDETFFSLDLFAMGNGEKIMKMVEQVIGEKLSDNQQEINKNFKKIERKSIKRNNVIKR
jgi:hypothetical protein